MSLNNISNNNTENNNLPDINEKAKQKTGTASFRATAMSVTLLTKSSIIYGLTSGVFFFISLISRPFSGSTSDYYNFKATRVIDKLCSQFLKEKMNRIFGSLFIGTSINRINANKKEFQTISDLIKRNSFPFLKTKEFSPLLKGGTCFGIILDLAKKYIASNEPGAGGMNVFKNQCLSLKKGSSPDAAVYQNIFPSTLGSTKSEPLENERVMKLASLLLSTAATCKPGNEPLKLSTSNPENIFKLWSSLKFEGITNDIDYALLQNSMIKHIYIAETNIKTREEKIN